MRFRKLAFILLIVSVCFSVFLFRFATSTSAQVNTCPAITKKVIEAATLACQGLKNGQLCNGALLSVKPSGGSDSAIMDLAVVESIQGAGVDLQTETWSVGLAKVNADAPTTLAVLGNAQITNLVTANVTFVIAQATNKNNTSVNITSEPSNNGGSVGTLRPLETVIANARTEDSAWVRVERNGLNGWVRAAEIALDTEIGTLTVANSSDLTSIYRAPMQNLILETGDSKACVDTPDGLLVHAAPGQTARLLVNGVQVNVAGSAFISAAAVAAAGADTIPLKIEASDGITEVSSSATSVTLQPGAATEIQTADGAAVAAPSAATQLLTVPTADELIGSLMGGQPYGGDGSTIRGLAVTSGSRVNVNVGDLLRVDLQFTGDAAMCAVKAPTDLNVVLAVDTSGSLSPLQLQEIRAALTNSLFRLNNANAALVAFAGEAKVLSALGEKLDASLIEQLVPTASGDAPALQLGLADALAELKNAPEDEDDDKDSAKAIVLFTGSIIDSEALQNILADIKQRAIRLIVVNVGQTIDSALLGNLVNDAADAITADNNIEIRSAVEKALLQATRAVAATGLQIIYTYDDASFELIPALLPLFGGTATARTVQWTIPSVSDTETVTVPLVLRATKEGTTAAGTLQLQYRDCNGSSISTTTVQVPEVEVTSDRTAASTLGVVKLDATVSNTLNAFDKQSYLLDVPGDQVISVVTDGLATAPQVLIDGQQPLYTVEDAAGENTVLSVFFVSSQSTRWLTVNSLDAEIAGDYHLTLLPGLLEEPVQVVSIDGAPILDTQVVATGKVYTIEGASAGSLVTVRLALTGNIGNSAPPPFEVVSLDGASTEEVITTLDANENTWVSVRRLTGAGPYFFYIKQQGDFAISIENGDTWSIEREALELGKNRFGQTRQAQSETLSYNLTIAEAGRYTLRVSNAVGSLRLNDPNNQQMLAVKRLNVSDFRVISYDLPAGDYKVYLNAKGPFEVSVGKGEVIANLKGSVTLGGTLDENLPEGESFAIYRLVTGTLKPLTEGTFITVQITAPTVSADNVFIESADGLASERISYGIDNRNVANSILTTVLSLRGNGPYRLRVNGLTSYRLSVQRGDLLSTNKGVITPGQTLRDSSRSLEVLVYTIAPELGRKLIEGDIITIEFAPEIAVSDLNADIQFGTQFRLENGRRQEIKSLESYEVRGRLRLVYQLQGQGPYRLFVPNVGAYTLSVQQGNLLRADRGVLPLDRPQVGQTDGPQIVQFTVEEPEDTAVTITVRLTNLRQGETSSQIFNQLFTGLTYTNAAGQRLVLIAANYNRTFDGLRLVFQSRGPGPYTLSFPADSGYEVSYALGDKVTFYRGVYLVGDAEVAQLQSDEPRVVAFEADLERGQIVTVWSSGGQFVMSPSSIFIEPRETFYFYDNRSFRYYQTVYEIRETGKYLIQFYVSPGQQYTFAVKNDDELTLDKGTLFYDTVENDRLPNERRYARYSFTGEQGQLVTLRLDRPSGGLDFKTENIQVFDSRNRPIELVAAVSSSSTGYLLQTYRLTGVGPYTLVIEPPRLSETTSFYPQSDYRLLLKAGDLLNIDKGVIPHGQQIIDRIPTEDSYRRVSYTLEGQQGEAYTFRIGTPSGQNFANYTTFPQLLDADGNIIPEDIISTDQRNVLIVYQLSGTGPYRFVVDISGDYALSVAAGNLVQQDNGVLEPGVALSGQLKAPVIVSSYEIDLPEDTLIDLQLEVQSGRSDIGLLVNADGETVPPDNVLTDRQTVYVYRLRGAAPYQFRFLANTARYTITLNQVGNSTNGIPEDVLTFNAGAIPVNPASFAEPNQRPVEVTGRLTTPQRFVYGLIERNAGDTITLQLEAQGSQTAADPLLLDADGNEIAANVVLIDRATRFAVYDLTGTPPYRLAFQVPSGFRIVLTEGDILRAHQGTLATGLQAEPPAFEIVAPARLAVHSLDVAPGQLITVQLQAQSRGLSPLTLVDGNGNTINAEFTDFQNGNNVGVFILSGVGPYQLSFPVSGRYTASVLAGNLLRVDGGIIPFNETVEGELEAPGRVLTYVIDGKRDQLITIQLQAADQDTVVEFRDANGKLWQPILTFTRQNFRYIVHQLSGPPPYNFTFGSSRYNVTVAAGNALRADLGVIPLDVQIVNTLAEPAVTAVYGIDGQPGELVSFLLQDAGRPVDGQLFNADNQQLDRLAYVTRNNVGVSVYQLSGAGPYRFEFNTGGPYNIRALKGNALRAELGVVLFDTRLTNTLPAPADTAVYVIDAREGEQVLVELQVSGRPSDLNVFNGLGNAIDPDAKLDKNNLRYRLLTLTGPGPYTLEFFATAQYNLTVYRGDQLRKDQGVIRFGNTVRAQLSEPAEVAVYTVDAQAGDDISIQLQDANKPLDSELVDARGTIQEPTGKSIANNSTYTVYTLTGEGPYKLTFIPQGAYALTLTSGSVLVKDFGVVTFGTTITNQLRLPTVRAVYQLVTAPGQIVSAKITSRGRGEFVTAELRDAAGNVIQPQTRVLDGTSSVIYVYELTGNTPYTFSFETINQYVLTFTRGDASQTQFPIFPTPTPTMVPR